MYVNQGSRPVDNPSEPENAGFNTRTCFAFERISTLKHSPYLCSARHHPDLQASFDAAIRENPENAEITPSYLTEHQESSDRDSRIVTSFTKYWARGRTLKIRFLGNTPSFLQQLFFDAACQWLPHVNLKFVLETSGEADIRIAIDQGLHWSAVGTDALLAQHYQDVPTMGFDLTRLIDAQKLVALQGRSMGVLDIKTLLSADFERVVLHEFGHALGAEHEHQHPNANIPWDEEAVLKDYAAKGMSEAFIRQNILDHYEAADFSYSAYDPRSVMHYNVPDEHTVGDFEIDNTGLTLSAKDIEFMNAIYGDRPNSRGPLA